MTLELAITFNRMRVVTEHRYVMDWCGVCRRPTDHMGEHPELVELGLAEQTDDVTYYTNGDGRTVHASHETGVHLTGLGGSAYLDAARRIINAAYDREFDIRLAGKVSLIKPVGEVITALGRPAKVA